MSEFDLYSSLNSRLADINSLSHKYRLILLAVIAGYIAALGFIYSLSFTLNFIVISSIIVTVFALATCVTISFLDYIFQEIAEKNISTLEEIERDISNKIGNGEYSMPLTRLKKSLGKSRLNHTIIIYYGFINTIVFSILIFLCNISLGSVDETEFQRTIISLHCSAMIKADHIIASEFDVGGLNYAALELLNATCINMNFVEFQKYTWVKPFLLWNFFFGFVIYSYFIFYSSERFYIYTDKAKLSDGRFVSYIYEYFHKSSSFKNPKKKEYYLKYIIIKSMRKIISVVSAIYLTVIVVSMFSVVFGLQHFALPTGLNIAALFFNFPLGEFYTSR